MPSKKVRDELDEDDARVEVGLYSVSSVASLTFSCGFFL